MIIPLMINLPDVTDRHGKKVPIVLRRIIEAGSELYVVRIGDKSEDEYSLDVLLDFALQSDSDFVVAEDPGSPREIRIPIWEMRKLVRNLLQSRTFDDTLFEVHFGAHVVLSERSKAGCPF